MKKRLWLAGIVVTFMLLVLTGMGTASASVSIEAQDDGGLLLTGTEAGPCQWINLLVQEGDHKRVYIGQERADQQGDYRFTFSLPAGFYQALLSGSRDWQETILFESESPGGDPGSGSDPGGDLPPPIQGGTVSVSVQGDAATGTVLPAQSWTWSEGYPSVLDALKAVLDRYGISYRVTAEGYVSSIGGLAEKQPGYPLSGWLYTVNGQFSSSSASSYRISTGGVIRWLYTRDGGRDVGNPYPVGTVIEDQESMELLARAREIIDRLEKRLEERRAGDYRWEERGIMPEDERVRLKEQLSAQEVFLNHTVDEPDTLLTDPQQEIIVHFPAGCLDGVTQIGIRETAPSEGQHEAGVASPVFVIDPEAVVLNQPVTVALRMVPPPPEEWESLTPACYNAQQQTWVPLAGVFDPRQGWMAFQTDRLGTFAIISRPHEPLSESAPPEQVALQQAVGFLLEEGILAGTGQGLELERTITRAELSQMLYRLAGSPPCELHRVWADVSETDWFAPAAHCMAEREIMIGFPAGEFRPAAAVDRFQMACIADRWLQSHSRTVTGQDQVDIQSPLPSWSAESAQRMVDQGWMKLSPGSRFDGDRLVVREDAVWLIYRISQAKRMS